MVARGEPSAHRFYCRVGSQAPPASARAAPRVARPVSSASLATSISASDHAGVDAHVVQHVHHLLGSHVAAGPGLGSRPARPARRTRSLELQGGEQVRQRGAPGDGNAAAAGGRMPVPDGRPRPHPAGVAIPWCRRGDPITSATARSTRPATRAGSMSPLVRAAERGRDDHLDGGAVTVQLLDEGDVGHRSSVPRRTFFRLWVSLAETTTSTSVNHRDRPLRAGSWGPAGTTPSTLLVFAHTSSASAICGIAFGWTNDSASIRRTPVCERLQQPHLGLGRHRWLVLQPVRGPTSGCSRWPEDPHGGSPLCAPPHVTRWRGLSLA